MIRDSKTGQLSVDEKNTNKNVNSKAAQYVRDAIKSKVNIQLKLVSGKTDVIVDSYESGEVDVADIKAYSSASKDVGAARIVHVLKERQVAGELDPKVSERDRFDIAHKAAEKAESEVVRGPKPGILGLFGVTTRADSKSEELMSSDYFNKTSTVKEQYLKDGSVIKSFTVTRPVFGAKVPDRTIVKEDDN